MSYRSSGSEMIEFISARHETRADGVLHVVTVPRGTGDLASVGKIVSRNERALMASSLIHAFAFLYQSPFGVYTK